MVHKWERGWTAGRRLPVLNFVKYPRPPGALEPPRSCYSSTVSGLNGTLESVARPQSFTVINKKRVAEIEGNNFKSYQ